MRKMFTLRTCSRLILSVKHAEFVVLPSIQRGTKKKHMFLYHYGTKQQMGGRGPARSDLPLNILRRGPMTYYSISFDQHKNFYDFFSPGVVDTF